MTNVILNDGEQMEKIMFVSDLIKSFQRIQKGKQFRVWYSTGNEQEGKRFDFVDGTFKTIFNSSVEILGAFEEIVQLTYVSIHQIVYLETGATYDVKNEMFKQPLDVSETSIFNYLRGVWDKEQLITVTAKDKEYKIIRVITGKVDVMHDSGYVAIRHDDDASVCTEMEFGEIMGIQERLNNEDSIEFTFINSNNWREKE